MALEAVQAKAGTGRSSPPGTSGTCPTAGSSRSTAARWTSWTRSRRPSYSRGRARAGPEPGGTEDLPVCTSDLLPPADVGDEHAMRTTSCSLAPACSRAAAILCSASRVWAPTSSPSTAPPLSRSRTPFLGRRKIGLQERRQSEQSTATARAAQISRIRVSRKRPNRLTRIATDTLSTESRLTAERRGTGSSPGSSTTSLTRPRIVVVHGATSTRRCRGITASRDRTTTGRRPISAISHHHTSPRAGRALTTLLRHVETTPGRPIRLARRADARRRRRSSHLPRPSGSELAEPQGLRPRAQRSSPPSAGCGHDRAEPRRPWYSTVCETCHHHAT